MTCRLCVVKASHEGVLSDDTRMVCRGKSIKGGHGERVAWVNVAVNSAARNPFLLTPPTGWEDLKSPRGYNGRQRGSGNIQVALALAWHDLENARYTHNIGFLTSRLDKT